MVIAIAEVNSMHDQLKEKIVESLSFPTAERSSLLHQLDIVPITFPVFGFVISPAAVKRLLAAAAGTVVPGLLKIL